MRLQITSPVHWGRLLPTSDDCRFGHVCYKVAGASPPFTVHPSTRQRTPGYLDQALTGVLAAVEPPAVEFRHLTL